MDEQVVLTEKLLAPKISRNYMCLKYIGEKMRDGVKIIEIPFYRLQYELGMTRDALNNLWDPDLLKDSKTKAGCGAIIIADGNTWRAEKRLGVHLEGIRNICIGCPYRGLNCPIALAVDTTTTTPLVVESKSEKSFHMRNVYLDRAVSVLSRQVADPAQFILPVTDMLDLDSPPASIYDAFARNFLNPQTWRKIVEYHVNYASYTSGYESANIISVGDRLNSLRLMFNGTPPGFLMDASRMHKVKERFYQSLQYALDPEQYKALRGALKEGFAYTERESGVVEICRGMDKLRSVLEDDEIKAMGVSFPHVYDFYRYIANGHGLARIQSLYGIRFPEATIQNYQMYMKQFLGGDIRNDSYFYSAYALPSSIAMMYFLDGMRYGQVEEDSEMIDTKIINIGKALFAQKLVDITDEISEMVGVEQARKIYSYLTGLRSFYRAMFELDGNIDFEIGRDDDDRVVEILGQIDRIPESAIKLASMPQKHFSESRLGFISAYGIKTGEDLHALSIEMYKHEDYLPTATDIFVNMVLNLSTRIKGDMSRIQPFDWLAIFEDHQDGCEQFAKLVYTKMHASEDGIAS